jgi:hypothetical protein
MGRVNAFGKWATARTVADQVWAEPEAPSPSRPGASRSNHTDAVIIGSSRDLTYRVLRCTAAIFPRVHLLMEGEPGSADHLRRSRFCASLAYLGPAHFDDPSAVADINAACERLGASVVIPSGVRAVHLLTRHGPAINAITYPVPSEQAFLALETKWNFAAFCAANGIDHPRTMLFQSTDELRAFPQSDLPEKFMLKPIDREASEGVMVCSPKSLDIDLCKVDYAPILLQEFVEGEDIGGIAACEDGKLVSATALRYVLKSFLRLPYRDSMELFDNEPLMAALTKVVAASNYNGGINIDCRLRPDKSVVVLECNPRFWNSIDWAMMAGVNFVELGLRRRLPMLTGNTEFQRAIVKVWPNVLVQKIIGRGAKHPYFAYLMADPAYFWGTEIPRMFGHLLRAVWTRIERRTPAPLRRLMVAIYVADP